MVFFLMVFGGLNNLSAGSNEKDKFLFSDLLLPHS